MNTLLQALPSDSVKERSSVAANYANDRNLQKWLAKCRRGQAPAVVLGSGPNGLSFARSLGRRGVPTLVLDSKRYVGTYSRYATAALLPSANDRPQDWIDCLEFVGSHLKTSGVLFATSDVGCQLVAQNKSALERYFLFLVPDAETVERIVDKRLQYQCADKAGIRIPKTYFPESHEQLRTLSGQVDYPCILKPYKSHLGRPRLSSKKLLVVNTPAELITAYGSIADGNVSFMIQEVIPGDDDALFGYLAFWDAQGRELAWLTKRKLRQNLPLYGDGSLQITVNAPEVAEQSRRLLRSFDYRGFCSVEYKFDLRDKTYRLMEINPRTVSGNQLAIDANVDLPWIGYRSLLGEDLQAMPQVAFRSDVKLVNEGWDFQAYLALRKTGKLTLLSWLQSLRGAKPAIWAWDDPLPMILSLGSFLRRVCSKLGTAACRPFIRSDRSEPRQ